MAKSSVLNIKIVSDASQAKRGFDEAEGKADGFGRKLAGLGGLAAGGIAAAAAGVAAIGKAAFDAASNLQQQAGAVDAIFGDTAGKMHQFAKDAATTAGLSQAAYSEMAAVMGAQLGNAGFAGDELAAKVHGLIGTGADLAAQFGGSTAEAVAALSSAFKGETDPIERYGVSIKQADINAQLAKMGMEGLTGEAGKQAQALAVMALVQDQTATSTGAFAREAGSAAGAQQIFAAQVENLMAKLGEGLLPIFSAVVGWISDKVIPWVERLTDKNGGLGQAFDQVAGFIRDRVVPMLSNLWSWLKDNVLPIWAQVGRVITDVVVPAFSAIWDFVSSYVVPIFKAVLGPALSGIRDAFKTVADRVIENKDRFSAFYESIKPFIGWLRDTVAPFIGTVLGGAFRRLGDVIGTVVDAITWVLNKAGSVIGFVSDLFGAGAGSASGPALTGARAFAAPAAPAALRGATFSPAGSSGPASGRGPAVVSGGDTFHVTITGVLNADDAADQIARLLARRDRYTGRALAAAL